MSWPFLARPSDEPDAVGLLSLRLQTTWFSTLEDGRGRDIGDAEHGGTGHCQGQAAESPSSKGSSTGSTEDWGQASGGRRGPLQWDEEKAVLFIQVCARAYASEKRWFDSEL